MDPTRRPRKRARMACTWCHERKVRCDVSIHGSPCTNCRLDGHECAIRESATRGRTAKVPPAGDIAAQNPLVHKIAHSGGTPSVDMLPQIPDLPQFVTPDLRIPFSPGLWGNKDIPMEIYTTLEDSIPRAPPSLALEVPHHNVSIVFSSFRFLELQDLPSLPAEDVRFLEIKGCLHVPGGPILDQFVRQYFLHVHPGLPVIHEGDFWRSYYNRPGHSGTPRTVSLFVFQAMLFASCAFVPPAVISAAGFPDSRTARNILYSRAKLLYDFNAEHNMLSKAQGCVLLTYQSSPTQFRAGSFWISNAIENALAVGAHNYNKLDKDEPMRNTKKRLWWSILLRDRILPLGLRRHLQVSPKNFDLTLDFMNEDDLLEEIYCSEVYDAQTKRHLATILNVQCQLAMVLTDVVATVYSVSGYTVPKKMTDKELDATMEDVTRFRGNLSQWVQNAKNTFSPFTSPNTVHKSVILYSELTYMYYRAARVALCHYEALVLEANSEIILHSPKKRLGLIKDELESASLGFTKSVKRLLALGVAHHLPISAVAYTALPLILNAVDVKLSDSTPQSASKKRRLRYYAEIMQMYSSRYDGTDRVALLIREILRLVDDVRISIRQPESGDSGGNQETKGWAEVFVLQPRLYLRMSLTLDYALSRGQYPQDTDLPVLVRDFPVKQITGSVIERTKTEETEDIGLSQSHIDTPESTGSANGNTQTSHDSEHSKPPLPGSPSSQSAAASPDWINQKQESSPTSSDTANQPSFSPPYQHCSEFNLDFLDLDCVENTESIDYSGGRHTPNWADAMLSSIQT